MFSIKRLIVINFEYYEKTDKYILQKIKKGREDEDIEERYAQKV